MPFTENEDDELYNLRHTVHEHFIRECQERFIRECQDRFERQIGELRRKEDERHKESSAQLTSLEGRIIDHAATDDKALALLDQKIDASTQKIDSNTLKIDANTKTTEETNAVVKDLAVMLKVGRGALTFAKVVGNIAKWAGSTALTLGAIYAFWLWVTGKSPLPPF